MSASLAPRRLAIAAAAAIALAAGHVPPLACAHGIQPEAVAAPAPRNAAADTPAAPPQEAAPSPGISASYLGAQDLAELPGADENMGGLSGLDRIDDGRYLALSDDGAPGATRAYDLRLGDAATELGGAGDLAIPNDAESPEAPGPAAGAGALPGVVGTIALRDPLGDPYQENLDPESIRRAADGSLWWSTEATETEGQDRGPAIIHSTAEGVELSRILPPEYHAPDADAGRGVKHNQGIEGIALDGDAIVAVNEGPLRQDDAARLADGSRLVRLTVYDLHEGRAVAEYPLAVGPVYPGASDRGISEILDVGDGSYLVLERGYLPEENRNRAEIYRIRLDGEDVLGLDALTGSERPVGKTLVFNFAEATAATGLNPDNVEGMAWGEEFPGGGRELLVVSDNNFNASQKTLVHRLVIAPAEA